MESLFKFSLTGSLFYLTPFLFLPLPVRCSEGRKWALLLLLTGFQGFSETSSAMFCPGSPERAHTHSLAHAQAHTCRRRQRQVWTFSSSEWKKAHESGTSLNFDLVDRFSTFNQKMLGGGRKKRSGRFHLSLLSLSKQLTKLVISCSACQLEWN